MIEKRVSELFFRKTVRERIYYELTSKKKRETFFKKIAHSADNYIDKECIFIQNDELTAKNKVMNFLTNNSCDSCYCISYDERFDGKILNIAETLDSLFGNGMPFMLITILLDKSYLETEFDFKSHKNYFLQSKQSE